MQHLILYVIGVIIIYTIVMFLIPIFQFVGFVGDMWNGITGFFKNLLDSGKEMAMEGISALVNIGDFIRGFVTDIFDTVTNVFKTVIEKGKEIMDSMVGFVTGFSVPSYIVTTTLGKIPVNQEYISTDQEGRMIAHNYKQQELDITEYIKPPSQIPVKMLDSENN